MKAEEEVKAEEVEIWIWDLRTERKHWRKWVDGFTVGEEEGGEEEREAPKEKEGKEIWKGKRKNAGSF